MPLRRTRLSSFALAAVALATACGGAQFDGREFSNDELAFRVQSVPDGWREIEVTEELVAFRDDARGATISVYGRCGRDGDDVPLTALTHHLLIGFTDREVKSQESLQLDGREALRTEVRGKLDGVETHLLVYVLKKNTCVYDFLHITTAPASGVEPFERFVQGFSTVRP